MKEQLHSVFVANGDTEAHAVQAFLEAAGIVSRLQWESLGSTLGLTVDGLGRVEVLVAEADEERARALLRSVERGDFRLGDDVETGS